MINETLQENKRLFLSHFTSITHHPWVTPDGFDREKYFADDRPMNKYVNAVYFADTWLGDLRGMVEEAGIANETLTVFVADQYDVYPQKHDFKQTF